MAAQHVRRSGRPQPVAPRRTLPATPATDSDEGLRAGLNTRILLSLTVVLGQLWALTVGLEEFLMGHGARAWWLAGFSLLSFLVVLLLVRLDPPRRNHPR